MQYGFVIDQSRCIGCHACTVACKSENHVPLGNFRTWVKYTEAGEFPQVRRSFAVLRCNQCTAAPCVEICPVAALEKRPDGIVDVDPARCIGCKACMQACPYDALYLNEETGTAQKCHFCAHRTERGLAPACAVVCPTEAIVPGDFDDPESVVSRMKREGRLAARKVEAGTGPNVFYKQADPAGLDPGLTNGAGGYLWANRAAGPQADAEEFRAMEERARSRTVYDVPHPPMWGWMVSAYLLTKSLAAGVFLAAACALPGALLGGAWGIPVLALGFLALTAGLLVGDLKKPGRFLFILLKPQWRSWLCRGAVILTAYGGLLAALAAAGIIGVAIPREAGVALLAATAAAAVLTAGYTAWLFAQAKGRVLWMRRGLFAHLTAQAAVAGFAFLFLLSDLPVGSHAVLRAGLLASLAVHALLTFAEPACAPRGREAEYRLASRLVTHGPYASRHWAVGVVGGIAVPAAILLGSADPMLWAGAGALALAGLCNEEDILVRAGQALPIS